MTESSTARDRGRMPAALLLGFLGWAVTFIGARLFLEGTTLAGVGRVGIALVPLPFFVLALVAVIRRIRGMDELERRIQLEALAVAFPLTLVLLMTLALLEVAQPLDPRNWSYRHLWPFPILFYTIGLALARRRYQ